jgi:hypothetical protein
MLGDASPRTPGVYRAAALTQLFAGGGTGQGVRGFVVLGLWTVSGIPVVAGRKRETPADDRRRRDKGRPLSRCAINYGRFQR